MNLKCFVPSERSKIQNFTCCQIPFTCHPIKNKTIAMGDRSVFFRDGVGENFTTKGQLKGMFWDDGTILWSLWQVLESMGFFF